jgi:putative ABC transport system permease protein
LSDSLKEGGRGSAGSVNNRRLRGTLVAGEVAIALVLVIGVGLLTKSFARTIAVNPGFQSRNVIAFPITLPASRYAQPAQQADFYRKLVERVQGLGAGHVAATTYLPLSGSARFVFFCPEGLACQGLGKDPIIAVRQVTPDYFQTIQTPLLRGRAFADQDSADNLKTVIVNQAVADHYWPKQDPIGRHLANSRDKIQRTVVGVVADVKFNSLTSPVIEEMYLPMAQSPGAAATLIVRSQSDVRPLVEAVRNELGTIDSDISFGTIQKMDELLASSVAQPRLTMQFMGVFAGLALMLSLTGLYAVMSYIVLQQKRELGIRMALGAQRTQVLRMVLQHGMTVTMIGLAIGAALSFALTRLLAGLLFDIRPTDPLTFAGSIFILALTALIACYLPARRAAQVDPIVTLRDE